MLKVKKSDPCPKCNKCFSDKKNLENHMKNNVCQRRTQKKCDKCGHLFKNAGGYSYHTENEVCKYLKPQITVNFNGNQESPSQVKPKITIKTQNDTINQLQSDVRILQEKIKAMEENAKNIKIENIQNIHNIQNYFSVQLTNFGKENNQSIRDQLENELRMILTSKLSDCIPLLLKIIHDGQKFPQYQNIYATIKHPNTVYVWNDQHFIGLPKKNIIHEIIQTQRDILSDYIDTNDLGDQVTDQFLDYQTKIDEETQFLKRLESQINKKLIEFGLLIKDQIKN